MEAVAPIFSPANSQLPDLFGNIYLLEGARIFEKLIGSQLVKKFPAFYGTRRYITAFTSARHISLSWASSIQSMPPYPTSWISVLILSPIYVWVF